MEESLLVRIFEETPSAEEFSSQIEPRNSPAVFKGCVKDWIAFSRWNPSNGGLDYLQELVGSSAVEAMLSRSAPIFYGDIRRHERVPLPFSVFIDLCKQNSEKDDHAHSFRYESEKSKLGGSDADHYSSLIADVPQNIYLAQVPILNSEDEKVVQLRSLREDIKTPSFLSTKKVDLINLWMNSARSRTSSHYDPHHNLLCIVAGCKRVVLWPPSASSLLYPMPLYGEASNHSSVALDNPDLSIHPKAESAFHCSQTIILQEGDALFIPEGWFHQVDSDDLTIAVNFWWRSSIMSSMLDHMDAYYLRRILRRLIDKEMNQMMHKNFVVGSKKMINHMHELPIDREAGNHENSFDQDFKSKDSGGEDPNQSNMLHDLGPLALWALHEIVSLVHKHVNATYQAEQSTSAYDLGVHPDMKCTNIMVANLYNLEDDPVAKILWNLGPLTLQRVFLAMVQNFPRTLEALILHMLSPVGAEVLTRKFDEMDQQTTEEDRSKFYQLFYAIFDDQNLAMEAILNGKESFAHQAFKNVLNLFVGVNLGEQKLNINSGTF
ncbi:hypothetical protein Nepgr_029811 [Nepenthes gracilis]|uniref:JmjC domain-containing protein n=1 Tax=Nepenthes gracilis TaxID=150966 RepID=A0AAD3TF83_NEPGR|nr:hypothetical protein Nepgr_029811 [Nepenthes gracilis]